MAQDTRIRVVVADAHPLFVLGVRALLAADAAATVVAEAHDGEQTLKVVERERPDFLLLDLAIGRIPGLEVLRRLAVMNLPTRTVVVTSAIQTAELRTALLRGARGVLLRHMPTDLLPKCIRQVMKGEYWIGRDNVGDLVDALRKSAKGDESSTLSHREREIVKAILRGASNKDIAWQLGLGEQTVKNHLRRIFAKVGVANRVELAVNAMARQLSSESDADAVM